MAKLGRLMVDASGTILEVDAAFCATMRMAADDLIGRSALGFTAPADRDRCVSVLAQVMAERVPLATVKRMLRADGTHVWVANSLRPIEWTGGTIACEILSDEAVPPSDWVEPSILLRVARFILATRPLTQAEVAATVPGNRTYVTSLNIGNYFRLSPDNRMIFGGRARFSTRSDQQSDAKSGAILRAGLARMFPQLGEVGIDYCWGGLVDMTQDRFPRAGRQDGVWYAMGYSGHGAQMSTHLGVCMADTMLGRPDRNPVDGMAWPAVPGHFGQPWFLPLVGLYYKALDRFR